MLERPGALLRTGLALAAGVSMITMISADRAEAAPTVTINSVVGSWVSTTGGSGGVSGLGGASISWPSSGTQSGYDFVGIAPSGPHDPDEIFSIGTFNHRNFPIPSGTAITSARLKVDVSATFINGGTENRTLTSFYDFEHWETTNATPCPPGSTQSICDDRVRAVLNTGASESFDLGDISYYFNITGFQVGGVDFTEFWTAENANNQATLRGSFTANVIPLPAAAWLLIGGLGAVAQRRKAAA